MTCRAQAGFVHHDLDFSQPTPMGFARCRRCCGFFTMAQYVEWRCDGAPQEVPDAPLRPPLSLHSVPCALCGAPVIVDPMHRAVVEWFGVTCDACFGMAKAL